MRALLAIGVCVVLLVSVRVADAGWGRSAAWRARQRAALRAEIVWREIVRQEIRRQQRSRRLEAELLLRQFEREQRRRDRIELHRRGLRLYGY